MNLDDIIFHHTEAMGGAAAIESVTSIRVEFTSAEPDFTVDGIYVADRLGRVRVDVYMGGDRVFSEGFDGSVAWQLPRGSQHGQTVSEAGSRALREGVEHQVFGLHELSARGHRMTLGDPENLDERRYQVIRVDSPHGSTSWRYLDEETWRVGRIRQRKALHPDLDPTETVIETRMTDFRRLPDGPWRAFVETQIDLASGKILATTALRAVNVSPDVSETHFMRP